jgi:hypothetical protein
MKQIFTILSLTIVALTSAFLGSFFGFVLLFPLGMPLFAHAGVSVLTTSVIFELVLRSLIQGNFFQITRVNLIMITLILILVAAALIGQELLNSLSSPTLLWASRGYFAFVAAMPVVFGILLIRRVS